MKLYALGRYSGLPCMFVCNNALNNIIYVLCTHIVFYIVTFQVQVNSTGVDDQGTNSFISSHRSHYGCIHHT